jgi:hypothetical protein
MNPFLRRKPKRQRTGAVQDLAEGRKHVALACVLECGSPLSPLPLSDERFMESFNRQHCIGAMNRLVGRASSRADSSVASPHHKERRSTFRLMESFNRQDWTRNWGP